MPCVVPHRENLAILLSSGFDVRKVPTPAGVRPAPVTLTQSTMSGILDFRAKAVANARAYEGQMTMDVNKDDWASVGTFTVARFKLEALKPGTKYWARARAIGAAGPGAWSVER